MSLTSVRCPNCRSEVSKWRVILGSHRCHSCGRDVKTNVPALLLAAQVLALACYPLLRVFLGDGSLANGLNTILWLIFSVIAFGLGRSLRPDELY